MKEKVECMFVDYCTIGLGPKSAHLRFIFGKKWRNGSSALSDLIASFAVSNPINAQVRARYKISHLLR